MRTNSTNNISNSIGLKKAIHRDVEIIFLVFQGRWDWLDKIKGLPTIKYSRTHGKWYLPMTKKSYNLFLGLKIEYHIINTSGTTEDIASQGVQSDIDSLESKSAISTDNIDSSVDIHDNNHEPIIKYNGGNFYISIPYQRKEVLFLKQLEKTWWNNDLQQWISKASIYNLEQLQERYHLWKEQDYQFFEETIKKTTDPCTVELYLNPAHRKEFCVKIKGYAADIEYLKAIPHRDYIKDSKRWIIPFDTNVIKRLIDHYEKKGTKIINRIPDGNVNYKKIKSPYLQTQERLLKKLKPEEASIIRSFIELLTSQRYSVKTIKSYSNAFLKYISYHKDYPLQQHTEVEVNRYLTYLTNKGLSSSVVNVAYSAIKLYFEKVLYLPGFKLEKLKRPKKGRKLPTILSIKEVDRLLRTCDNLKHVTILYTLYSSGIRLGELLAIRTQDIHWDRNQIHIRSGKGDKDRMVMLSAVLKDVLSKYYDEYTPIYWMFEGEDKRSQYSSSSVQKIVRAAYIKAGISRKVTPHTLRHCFATHLLDHGTDVRYIQELLGHKDIKTTLIYTHVTTKKVIEIESPLDKIMSRKGKEKN